MVIAALSAMITAAKKGLDFVGVYALAVVTAFSGGTLRRQSAFFLHAAGAVGRPPKRADVAERAPGIVSRRE